MLFFCFFLTNFTCSFPFFLLHSHTPPHKRTPFKQLSCDLAGDGDLAERLLDEMVAALGGKTAMVQLPFNFALGAIGKQVGRTSVVEDALALVEKMEDFNSGYPSPDIYSYGMLGRILADFGEATLALDVLEKLSAKDMLSTFGVNLAIQACLNSGEEDMQTRGIGELLDDYDVK